MVSLNSTARCGASIFAAWNLPLMTLTEVSNQQPHEISSVNKVRIEKKLIICIKYIVNLQYDPRKRYEL